MTETQELIDQKKVLRKSYLKMRRALSRDSVEQKSYNIIQNIKKALDPEFKSFMFYIPINHEVDLLPFVKELFQAGKIILFPKLIDLDHIEPYIIHDLFYDFKLGAFNIPEPDTERYEGAIDAIYVPGLVFGEDGGRIGYGKSYYDRFLRKANVSQVNGVCFDFQILNQVPCSDLDYPMEQIISESGIITRKPE